MQFGKQTGAQPGILFGRGQSLTSSDFKLAILHKDHFDVTGQLHQDMTSNIFYQSASINFNKDKKTFAFAVIIIKQLLIFNEHLRVAESEAPCNVVLENITDYAY